MKKTHFLAGVGIASLTLGLVDLAHALHAAPTAAPLQVLFGAALLTAGAAVLFCAPLLMTRLVLWDALPSRMRWVVGALDALAFGVVGLLLEDMASVSMKARALITVGLVLGGALTAFVAQRRPRLWPYACTLGGAGVLGLVELLPPREKPWLRLALDVVACGLLASVFASLLARLKPEPAPRTLALVAAALLLLTTSGFGALLGLRGVRAYVYGFAPHAQALLAPLHLPQPVLENGNVFCKGKPRPARAPLRTAATAAAQGADVLFLSFDAMRFDQASAMPKLWAAIGPHVMFTHAVTPAPRTLNSLSALLRGVAARQVPWIGQAPKELVAAKSQPTIAQLLVKYGYRAVQVPTHAYFSAAKRMNVGFELAITGDFGKHKGDDGKHNIVPAKLALQKAVEVVRTTDKPLLLWVHLMEGHEPYPWHGGHGPKTKEGQRHAFSDLDARSAKFIARFRELRGDRPLVIAVFGDHGEEFQEHGGRFHSTSVYAEQVRAVLALGAPGLRDATLDAPVSHSALPATLLDLLGLPAAPTFSEPSLLPCIADRAKCPDVAVSQMIAFGNRIGYTFANHRLLVDPDHGVEQVFDARSDPLEKRDLAAVDPALLQALRDRAKRFDDERCVAPSKP